jgi:hypothetical protein
MKTPDFGKQDRESRNPIIEAQYKHFMKKLNLKLGGLKEMLSKEQMKKITGGDDYGYGDGNSKTCKYHCCTDQHTDCGPYQDGGNPCVDSSDCSGSGAYCVGEGGDHLYWTCN